MIHFSLINLCSGRKRGKYGQNYVLFSLQQGHFVPASVVEPVPGWNRLQTRKEPDPESPSSISRKEPNSYSGADSRPESLTPLVFIFSIETTLSWPSQGAGKVKVPQEHSPVLAMNWYQCAYDPVFIHQS